MLWGRLKMKTNDEIICSLKPDESYFSCCNCRGIIGTYKGENKMKTIRGYATICLKCLSRFEKRNNDGKDN